MTEAPPPRTPHNNTQEALIFNPVLPSLMGFVLPALSASFLAYFLGGNLGRQKIWHWLPQSALIILNGNNCTFVLLSLQTFKQIGRIGKKKVTRLAHMWYCRTRWITCDFMEQERCHMWSTEVLKTNGQRWKDWNCGSREISLLLNFWTCSF